MCERQRQGIFAGGSLNGLVAEVAKIVPIHLPSIVEVVDEQHRGRGTVARDGHDRFMPARAAGALLQHYARASETEASG